MATPDKLQEYFLTCSVCMEVYQRPVTLTCQHSFCEICLGRYLQTKAEAVRNKSIPCPTCRQETPVPYPDRPMREWTGQLKPGLLLTGLLDKIPRESEQCLVCKEEGKTTPAAHRCSECQTSFCDECLKIHNKMPNLRKHEIKPLREKDSQQRRSLRCKEHNEKMKLFCKDCNKSFCTVCGGIAHRTCKEVITIKEQLTEVKSKLQLRLQDLAERIDLTNGQNENIDKQTKNLLADRSLLESNIRKTIKEAIDALKEKEDQLIKKVKDQTDQDREQLRSLMKTKQIDLQLYQQQSQSIRQALDLEDEVQLFEMYLSSKAGAGADVTGTKSNIMTYVADISFKHDFDQLKEQIEIMDVMINKVDSNIPQINNINLTAAPILDEVIDAKLDARNSCSVTDCLIMVIAGTKVSLFTNWDAPQIISVYTKGGQSCSSVLKVSGHPWCLTVISEGQVAVSLPGSQRIITVAVTPDLKLLSTIQTRRKYKGLSNLDQSTLVAGSDSPSSVDLIDMKGTILNTFTSVPAIGKSFIDPHYIHVTRQGTILVSDHGLKSVICLRPSGDIIFTYTPTEDKALRYPYGITSTSTGDILVADCYTYKVIHMNQSGEFLRVILTEEDGLDYPTGLCIDEDKLCVSLFHKGLHKYRFD